ncbi:guanine deaminase [Cryptococcus wingfieldii CBS 7118]|uniref:Guanine deaminase n=1 Tax=Cryptococcus wingfieldii CBS 7118 TaxID=1295528 RepID=A0A1E3IZZ5_9TREE|nr:guanine deaminase [Cryptococcus wingfieldii CBS 7118]ODN93476.1 guanine deaminase [Cryptococcus wingfieldii CBS 7118]
MPQLFTGTFVDTPASSHLRVRRNHLLAVDDQGYISHVAPLSDPSSQALLKDNNPTQLGKHSFFLPTYADLHLHAPQYLYAGTGLDLPLLQWLERYAYRAEERIDSDEALAERVYGRLVERLRENGTGCVVFFGTIGVKANLVLARKVQESGIRAFIGKLSMDESPRPTYGEASALSSLTSLNEFLDSFESYISQFPKHRQLVQPIITPRFVPVCSDELLEGLAKVSKERNVRLQSHMCEGRDQIDMVMMNKKLDDEKVFDKFGLLTPQTLQAHVTYLDEDMSVLMKERGVTIAHCPLSNQYLSERQFPLREALDASLSLGLGTDIAGGYSPSIHTAMRQAVIISRMREGDRCEKAGCSFAGMKSEKEGGGRDLRVDWKEAMWAATRGGKAGMGLGGALEVGMEFDAQLIELASDENPIGTGPLDLFDLEDKSIDTDNDEWWIEVLERWWSNGDCSNRKGMWTQGVKVA